MNEPGERWAIAAHYEGPFEPDADGRIHFGGGVEPTCWVVTDIEGDEERGRYDTREKAEAGALRLNREDVERTLDPEFADRRKRLRRLGSSFWERYGEGHYLTRGPNRPGRYAAEEWSERYSESFWETYDDQAEIESLLRQGELQRVVDLDTGDEIDFTVEATVAWPGS